MASFSLGFIAHRWENVLSFLALGHEPSVGFGILQCLEVKVGGCFNTIQTNGNFFHYV
jgi:hypothetical protein